MYIDDIISGHANKNGQNEVIVGLAHIVTTKKKAPIALFFGMNMFADRNALKSIAVMVKTTNATTFSVMYETPQIL